MTWELWVVELPFPYSREFLRYPYIDGTVDWSLTLNPVYVPAKEGE